MKSLRETIRRLILEDTHIQEPPIVGMLKAMDSHNLFEDELGSRFAVGMPYHWEYYATDACVYDIKMNSDSTDVFFIEEINIQTEEPDEETKKHWPNPYEYDIECEGQGFATDMMQELMAMADEHGVQLSLQPSAFMQTIGGERPDTVGLTFWYKRLGFEDSPQDNGTLVYNFNS